MTIKALATSNQIQIVINWIRILSTVLWVQRVRVDRPKAMDGRAQVSMSKMSRQFWAALFTRIFSLSAPATSNTERKRSRTPIKMLNPRAREVACSPASTTRLPSSSTVRITSYRTSHSFQLFTAREIWVASLAMVVLAQPVTALQSTTATTPRSILQINKIQLAN